MRMATRRLSSALLLPACASRFRESRRVTCDRSQVRNRLLLLDQLLRQPLHRLDVADRYGPAKTLALPPVLALGDDLPPRLRLRERLEVRAVQPADDAANQPHSHHPTAIQNGELNSTA